MRTVLVQGSHHADGITPAQGATPVWKCLDVCVGGVKAPFMKDAFGNKNIPILKGSSALLIPIS